VLLGLMAACGGGGTGSPSDGGALGDGAAAQDGSASTDGGAPAKLLGEALDCAKVNAVGGIAASSRAAALEKKQLDVGTFPDALCNDGTPAIVYVRPSLSTAGRNKWVIQLMGGGACFTAASCASRWCSVGTNFSKTQMTSSTSPDKTDGEGIFARAVDGPVPAANPLEDANQVLVKYCSSDGWRGTARDVEAEVPHPTTGSPVRLRMHFLGRRILEALLATLRRDGVAALTYGTPGVELPDLDEATEVVLAGASAGGAGTTYNLDWLRATLRQHNATVEVLGLVDSILGPEMIGLDFSQGSTCSQLGLCTDAQYLGVGLQGQLGLWRAAPEESCSAAHPQELWKCASNTHVLTDHVTTPFFVRQGLSDGLISEPYVQGGLRIGGQPFTLALFGRTVAEQLEAFAQLASTSEEGSALAKTPGGYGPLCPKHETLRSTPDIFSVTISPTAGTPVRMFDAWTAWRQGQAGGVVVTKSLTDTACP
jgi:hypothetical protein